MKSHTVLNKTSLFGELLYCYNVSYNSTRNYFENNIFKGSDYLHEVYPSLFIEWSEMV